MPTRGQKFRLGLFVTSSVVLLGLLIVIFTTGQYFQEGDTYYIAFENMSVGGLEVGGSVNYLGIKVGVIEDLQIDPDNINRIIITVTLDADTPVHSDAEAHIVSQGVTGLKAIEIRGGTNEAPLLKDGDYIPPGSSFTEDITTKIERAIDNLVNLTAPENLDQFVKAATKANAIFSRLDSLLMENQSDIQQTVQAVEATTTRLDTVSQVLLQMAHALQQMATSDTAGSLSTSLAQLNQTLEHANHVLTRLETDLDQGGTDFKASMRELRQTFENLNRASRQLARDPSLLIRGANPEDTPDQFLEDN